VAIAVNANFITLVSRSVSMPMMREKRDAPTL
jgi:hypothetical protein